MITKEKALEIVQYDIDFGEFTRYGLYWELKQFIIDRCPDDTPFKED